MSHSKKITAGSQYYHNEDSSFADDDMPGTQRVKELPTKATRRAKRLKEKKAAVFRRRQVLRKTDFHHPIPTYVDASKKPTKVDASVEGEKKNGKEKEKECMKCSNEGKDFEKYSDLKGNSYSLCEDCAQKYTCHGCSVYCEKISCDDCNDQMEYYMERMCEYD